MGSAVSIQLHQCNGQTDKLTVRRRGRCASHRGYIAQ